MTQIESNFARLLTDVFSEIGLRFEGLQLLESGFSRQEYLDVFFSLQTERVAMVSLTDFSETPPDDFPYFNPDYDLNAMARRSNEIDRRELESARFRAKHNGNLRGIPTVRGLMRSSTKPQSMEFDIENETRFLQSSRDGRITLATSAKAVQAMSAIAIGIIIAATAGLGQVRPSRRNRKSSPTGPNQPELFDEGE